MNELTAFDVAYRGVLDNELAGVMKGARAGARMLVVAADSPAATVATRAVAINAEVVKVIDDSDATVGYIFPNWLTSQVSKRTPAATIVEAISVLESEPRDPTRSHLHEWLNSDRPKPRTCPGNGSPHPTFFNPCLEHGT